LVKATGGAIGFVIPSVAFTSGLQPRASSLLRAQRRLGRKKFGRRPLPPESEGCSCYGFKKMVASGGGCSERTAPRDNTAFQRRTRRLIRRRCPRPRVAFRGGFDSAVRGVHKGYRRGRTISRVRAFQRRAGPGRETLVKESLGRRTVKNNRRRQLTPR
jgi:hypothetical protein